MRNCQTLGDCKGIQLKPSSPSAALRGSSKDVLRLASVDSRVPDTQWGVTRDDVVAAASRFKRKRSSVSDSSDTDSEYNYLLGPSSKRRKKDNPTYGTRKSPKSSRSKVTSKTGHPKFETPEDPPCDELPTEPSTMAIGTQSTTSEGSPNGRVMVTATKAAARMQRLLDDYPLPTDQYPADFTLRELCSKYPNHLFGTNLYPFLQYKWSPNRIVSMMPSQEHLPEAERIGANAMNSRLKKVKVALEKAGDYEPLMRAEKTHAEGTLGIALLGGIENSDHPTNSAEKGNKSDKSEVYTEHTIQYTGLFDRYKYHKGIAG